jgi:hypothetical protein
MLIGAALSILIFDANGQTVKAKFPVLSANDIKTEFAKYPTKKSNLCPSCRIWVNPFYESIADTIRHMPIVEHYAYTRQHRLMQQALGTGNRKGPEAEWHHATAALDVTAVYSYANQQIGRPYSAYEIAYGHCGAAWVLLAWCQWGMVYSDVYDYNAAMEYQGQNVGTEIATEDRCRMLTGWGGRSGEIVSETDRIDIWAGTWTDPAKLLPNAKTKPTTYKVGDITVTVPDVYWKIMVYKGRDGNAHLECYWMPNQPGETKDLISARMKPAQFLVQQLGFNPIEILPVAK